MEPRDLSVISALKGRFSTRAYLDKPVPKSVVKAVLECARWSPSGANLQPWQVVVIMGETKAQLSAAIVEAYESGIKPHPEYPYYPEQWFEPYKDRRFQTGMALYRALGIERRDKSRREQQWKANYDFFGAPVGLLFLVEKRLGYGCWLDMGIFIQSIMLAARAYELSTCPQAAMADYPDVIRKRLKLSDGMQVMCGMSLGYADEQHPVNNYRTEREAVDHFTSWYD
jgi:nitroreductase